MLIVALAIEAIGVKQVLLEFTNKNLIDWKQGHLTHLTIV